MKVEQIINECVASGDKWTQASVQLSNGQIVRIFNPVMVGDEVYSELNGKYTNWKIKRNSGSINGDVEKLINQYGKDIQTLLGRVESLESKLKLLETNNNGNESRLSESDEMPEDFLKI